MTDSGDLRNLYPIPHGPVRPGLFVHEQYTLVESRFTVELRYTLAELRYTLAELRYISGISQLYLSSISLDRGLRTEV